MSSTNAWNPEITLPPTTRQSKRLTRQKNINKLLQNTGTRQPFGVYQLRTLFPKYFQKYNVPLTEGQRNKLINIQITTRKMKKTIAKESELLIDINKTKHNVKTLENKIKMLSTKMKIPVKRTRGGLVPNQKTTTRIIKMNANQTIRDMIDGNKTIVNQLANNKSKLNVLKKNLKELKKKVKNTQKTKKMQSKNLQRNKKLFKNSLNSLQFNFAGRSF